MLRALYIASIAVLLSLPAVARDAEARVVMMPSVQRSCPGAATWQATLTCLERFGTPKLLRSEGRARLVQLHGNEHQFRISGLYLYVQGKQGWRIGGMSLDERSSVSGLSTVRFGSHPIYRLDLVYAGTDDVLVDEVTVRKAFVRRKTALFCSGDSSGCTQIVTACDVFVSGKLFNTFRASLAYDRDALMNVIGDRTRAGEYCAQPEQTWLPMPSLDLGDDV
jgi:hypothetical protein